MDNAPSFQRLKLEKLDKHVLGIVISRPEKLNAFDAITWEEIKQCFEWLDREAVDCRAVVLSAEGRIFTAGVDLQTFGSVASDDLIDPDDVARKALNVYHIGRLWQNAMTSIENCSKVVIVCTHSGCIGAGLEMISACDIRFCTKDAYFIYKEGDVGIAADVGGLQRFPKIVGNASLCRELCFSGRKLPADEAYQLGLVSRILDTKETMIKEAIELANKISEKSPIATMGAKKFLNYSRDHTVQDSLDFALVWNMAMVQGTDMKEAAMSAMTKKPPVFPNVPKSKL